MIEKKERLKTIIADKPVNEKSRLITLDKLKLLNNETDENYNNITRLASFICETPVSLVTLIGENKQYFLSRVAIIIETA